MSSEPEQHITFEELNLILSGSGRSDDKVYISNKVILREVKAGNLKALDEFLIEKGNLQKLLEIPNGFSVVSQILDNQSVTQARKKKYANLINEAYMQGVHLEKSELDQIAPYLLKEQQKAQSMPTTVKSAGITVSGRDVAEEKPKLVAQDTSPKLQTESHGHIIDQTNQFSDRYITKDANEEELESKKYAQKKERPASEGIKQTALFIAIAATSIMFTGGTLGVIMGVVACGAALVTINEIRKEDASRKMRSRIDTVKIFQPPDKSFVDNKEQDRTLEELIRVSNLARRVEQDRKSISGEKSR